MRYILLLISLISIQATAQDFWRDITTNGLLPFVAGFADGSVEVVQHHYQDFKAVYPGANDQYWNPDISWRNKYRNGDPTQGSAFFGSRTFLVSLTDYYHLGRTVQRTTLLASAGIQAATYDAGDSFWTYAGRFVIQFLWYTAGFNISYNYVFR